MEGKGEKDRWTDGRTGMDTWTQGRKKVMEDGKSVEQRKRERNGCCSGLSRERERERVIERDSSHSLDVAQ